MSICQYTTRQDERTDSRPKSAKAENRAGNQIDRIAQTEDAAIVSLACIAVNINRTDSGMYRLGSVAAHGPQSRVVEETAYIGNVSCAASRWKGSQHLSAVALGMQPLIEDRHHTTVVRGT